MVSHKICNFISRYSTNWRSKIHCIKTGCCVPVVSEWKLSSVVWVDSLEIYLSLKHSWKLEFNCWAQDRSSWIRRCAISALSNWSETWWGSWKNKLKKLIKSHSSIALFIVLANEVRCILEGANDSILATKVNDIVLAKLSKWESINSFKWFIGLEQRIFRENDSLTLDIMLTVSNSFE